MAVHTVNCYFLPRNGDVPNSKLPVLHYQHVLPDPLNEDTATAFLEANQWEKRGTWGHIPIRHFHPNSHECYGIFQGDATLLLGKIASNDFSGLRVVVQAGDVIALPAGTAHVSLESSSDYRYIGVYPAGSPKWRNEYGKSPVERTLAETLAVGLPRADPVYGVAGPLRLLWRTNDDTARAKL